jgi:hypothetical protein
MRLAKALPLIALFILALPLDAADPARIDAGKRYPVAMLSVSPAPLVDRAGTVPMVRSRFAGRRASMQPVTSTAPLATGAGPVRTNRFVFRRDRPAAPSVATAGGAPTP